MTHCGFHHCIAALHLSAFAILAAATPAFGALIQIDAQGKSFAGAYMHSNWAFVGVAGDFIELGDGKHQLRLNGPRGYSFHFLITVTGPSVTISDSYSEPPNCQPALNVVWKQPTVRTHQTVANAYQILLDEPIFGSPTGYTSCTAASMAGCAKQKVVMEATSSPVGAEIWIDGELQPSRTNTTLSVPFCEYERSKSVVLRIGSSINCMQSLSLAPDARVKVTCNLQAIQRR